MQRTLLFFVRFMTSLHAVFVHGHMQGGDVTQQLLPPHVCTLKPCLYKYMQGGDITRDMVFISTKAGFITPELVDVLIKVGRFEAHAHIQTRA